MVDSKRTRMYKALYTKSAFIYRNTRGSLYEYDLHLHIWWQFRFGLVRLYHRMRQL